MASPHRVEKIIFTSLILLAGCAKTHLPKEAENRKYRCAALQDGDLVCRLGKGFFSEYFREYASRDRLYSHIGIVAVENNTIYVYHSEASELTGIGGVKKEKLADFLENIDRFSFFTVNSTPGQKKRIVSAAKVYLQKHTKFDLELRDGDNEVYCSELVAYCINQGMRKEIIRPTLKFKDRYVYALDDIYLNNSVYKIK